MLDDIFAALSTLDENRLMDYLQTFVSGEPMNLPTVNLSEGDLKAIMGRIDKMECLISHLQSTVNTQPKPPFDRSRPRSKVR